MRTGACPYDNAVIESTNRNFKSSAFFQRGFATTDELRSELNAYVWWYNNGRIHATLDYMSTVEFREAGLSLQEKSSLGLQLQSAPWVPGGAAGVVRPMGHGRPA